MSSESSNDQGGYGHHMKTVGWSILVMGISLAIVIVLWLWFGRIGPTFSSERLLEQQEQLRDQYGMPPQPPVSKELLETPPSLRNITNAKG
jgi:hypothetical protein